MQLPDASTHRYHMFGASTTPTVDSIASSGEYRTDINQRVVTKVKEVVRQGVTSPFVVRQIARNYVEKEMVAAGEEKVPKHDKKYFPPMIEIQNLIQQIQADLISGALTPLPMVSLHHSAVSLYYLSQKSPNRTFCDGGLLPMLLDI